jgi:hypothetical protein
VVRGTCACKLNGTYTRPRRSARANFAPRLCPGKRQSDTPSLRMITRDVELPTIDDVNSLLFGRPCRKPNYGSASAQTTGQDRGIWRRACDAFSTCRCAGRPPAGATRPAALVPTSAAQMSHLIEETAALFREPSRGSPRGRGRPERRARRTAGQRFGASVRTCALRMYTARPIALLSSQTRRSSHLITSSFTVP